jgi:hypothetical protein
MNTNLLKTFSMLLMYDQSYCLLHLDTCIHKSFRFVTFSMLYFQKIKPTVLIGTSGQGRTFTKEVIEAMASINEVPCRVNLLTCTSHAISCLNKLSNVVLFYNACRNLLSFLFPTQHHSQNVLLKKLISGAR